MFRSNEEIYSLVKAFEDRTLTLSEWTHTSQLAVGFFYCRLLPFAVAKNMMRDGIVWLNDRHGVENTEDSGYHETLTVFWLKRVWNYLDEHQATFSLANVANDLIEKYKDPDLPLKYYSRDVLFSAAARRDYVPPDLRLNRAVSLSITPLILKPLF